MRKFKKILKWTGLILLFLIVGVTITVMARQNLKYERPFPAIAASTDSAVIAHGKHIVFSAGHCADCHSLYNADSLFKLGQDVPLSGGYDFKLPFGHIYSRNITPDEKTGIGRYTDAEMARALRFGVRPDGTAMYPFMPFHNMSDEDLTAVISYLRAQKPVSNEVPEHTMNTMGKVIKAFFITPVGPTGEPPKSVAPDSTIEYGKYLANSVANCAGCHTKRTPTGGFEGVPFAGGNPMEEGGESFTPPNLTTDSSSRIFKWTEANFMTRFRLGKVHKNSHMPWNSYARMSDMEIKAIFKYLKSLPPAKTNVPD